MSKNIAISDDVYRRLKREKGDRSFSELIEERLDRSGQLADVTGQEIFEPGTYENVSEEISTLSDGTLDRMTDETS
jgi:predicted CopG family antitoxin